MSDRFKHFSFSLVVVFLLFVLVLSSCSSREPPEALLSNAPASSSQKEESDHEVPAKTDEQKYTSQGTPINENFDYDIPMIETPKSTCFSDIGYSSYSKILLVTFRDSGKSYAYYDVPNSVWEELRDAYSKGGYFNSYIKGYYDCELIAD